MFRSRALAKLQSPEKLDEPQRLLRRKGFPALLAVVASGLAALVWGFIGAIPEEGRGQGILLTPGAVKPVQVPATGQIVRWFVREADTVERGQVLGLVEQIRIEQQIEQERDKLEELQERSRVIGDLREHYSQSRRESVANRRKVLTHQIAYLEGYIDRTKKLSAETHSSNTSALRKQKQNLQKSKQAAVDVQKGLEKRLESYERLNEEKLIADDQLRDVRRDHEDATMKIAEINLRLQEMQLKEVQLKESYLNTQALITTRGNRLTNLKLQQRDLDSVIAQLDKADSEAQLREKNQIRDAERSIDRSTKRLMVNREIRSDYEGRVLELSAIEGQLMTQGQRVALIDTRGGDDDLVALAYFEPKHGKRLRPGTLVRVSPSTVDRNKHGGIIGEVQSVSDYPVTLEAVATQVGNRTVAQQLTAGGFTIEVVVQLTKSPGTPSGFQWTSERGPDVQLTAGTSAEVWSTVEQRAPISYVIPTVKGWLGI